MSYIAGFLLTVVWPLLPSYCVNGISHKPDARHLANDDNLRSLSSKQQKHSCFVVLRNTRWKM